MKKEIELREAINRFLKGEDTEVLLPVQDQDGNEFFRKLSFADYLRGFDKAMFLIEQKPSPTKGIKRGPRKKKEVLITESNNSSQEIEQPKSEPKPDMPISESAKRKKIDIGKLVALRRGKWTIKDIADELNVSQATVNKYLRKIREGEIKPAGYIDGYDEPEEE